MANIKSAKKRILVSNRRTLENQMQVSKMKTAIKKFNASVVAGNVELAEKLFPTTVSVIDMVCSKGCIHKNNAARKKSAVAIKLNNLKTAK